MDNSTEFSLPADVHAGELIRFMRQMHKLYELIMGDPQKRWLPRIRTILQRVIQEAEGPIPMHKNWPAICALAKANPAVATFIGRLDLENDPAAREWTLLYPECFAQQATRGPILMSVLMEHALAACREELDAPMCSTNLASHDTLRDYGIPQELFIAGTDADTRCCSPLPDGLTGNEVFGQQVELPAGSYIVTAQANVNADELCLSPVEFIHVDIKVTPVLA